MRASRPKEGEPIRLSFTKNGEPRYRVVLDAGRKPNGGRLQVSRTFKTLTLARAYVVETRAALAHGTYTAQDRTDFNDLCERWLASRTDVREVTRAGYRNYLKPVRAQIGARKIQELRRSDIEAVVAEIAAHGGMGGEVAAHRTVVVTLGTVRQVFAYALSEGVVPANVAVGVKAPRKRHDDAARIAVWEPSQLLAFRDVSDRDEWAAAWRITLSGLRRSEVLGLQWDAVDLGAGTVTVKAGRVRIDGGKCDVIDDPKSGASRRTVPFEAMHPGTVAHLRALRARQAAERLAAGPAYGDSGLVVVDALGRPIRPEAYSDRFDRLCRAAGVPRIVLHRVRHSIALALHRGGVAPVDAAALLGHSVEVHLATYVPPTEHGVRTAAHTLGTILARAQ